MKVDLSKYDNSWYRPASALKRACWYLVNALIFKSAICPFYRPKRMLLRSFGAKLGKAVVIKQSVNIKYPWLLEIGDYAWIGEQVWIDNLGRTVIGANACISQGALLLSGNHDFTKPGFDLIVKEILIEDAVWIGARSVVTGGAVCRTHAVLAAGSVHSGEMEAYAIYRGNPAVKIKERVIQ